jgi:hypothetical protein
LEINNIVSQFKLLAPLVTHKRWGEGHIHDTYLIETAYHRPDYILQKINGIVFRNIPGMMQNIEAICGHFRNKLTAVPGHDPDREALTLVHTKEGNSWYLDEEGHSWRMYVYIPDTVTYQQMSDPELAFEAGKAIGHFQSMLADLATPLVETITDFHNIHFRIRQYQEAKAHDPKARIPSVTEEIRFVEDRFNRVRSYYDQLLEKAVLHATHNDTKVNNILFDQHQKALCLIDLDTVMPGYVHFDYGDALRTMANTALEDEKDLSKVKFNVHVYEGFTKGYLEQAGDFLNPNELAMLPYAPIYLTFMIGLRFLTDYLNGDVYYRIHYPEHNLVRARVQFRLVGEMEKNLL